MADKDLVKHLTEEDFFSVIEKGITIVDFFATWCAPCRMLTPIIEQVAEHFGEKITVAKVDIDQDQKIAAQFQVTSVPTIVIYKDGKEINRFVGLRDFDTIKGFIDDVL